jgi:hypothetical protein
MKAVPWIAAIIGGLMLGNWYGWYQGYSVGYGEGMRFQRAIQLVAIQPPKMTRKEFEHEYEIENAPACYGHPRNEKEVEEIAGFNLREAKAENQAIQDGKVRY